MAFVFSIFCNAGEGEGSAPRRQRRAMFRVRQTLSHLACSSAWAVGMAPCAYAAGLGAQAADSGDAQNANHAGGRSRLRCAWISQQRSDGGLCTDGGRKAVNLQRYCENDIILLFVCIFVSTTCTLWPPTHCVLCYRPQHLAVATILQKKARRQCTNLAGDSRDRSVITRRTRFLIGVCSTEHTCAVTHKLCR